MDLLHADSESEVISILSDAGFWDDPMLWRLYGDKEGNFAQAGNQASLPEAALVEKIVNSVDARLMLECLRRKIAPESREAPESVREAVAVFFQDSAVDSNEAGTLINWGKGERNDEAKAITVAATGARPSGKGRGRFSLTVTDLGEGQSPQRLPRTILSLNEKNKQRVRFVQGKFNQGGSGALRFCGTQGLQLIISRRSPDLAAAESASDPTSGLWAVTVVRREEPSSRHGEPVHSEFTYLAPFGAAENPRRGEVLSFSAPLMPLMPQKDEAYVREVSWGTCLKLYEFETNVGQSHILMKDGLLYALERLVPEIALPVRLHECRGFRGAKDRSFETTLAGLVVRLEDAKSESLEVQPITAELRVAGLRMTARVYAFKEARAKTYLKNEGVIFTINGQAHGYLPKTIFTRRSVGLPRLKDSLLVVVDCSDLSVRQREDLFMSSRDRLSQNDIRWQTEREIEEFLRDSRELRALQQARRERDLEDQLSEEKPLEDVLARVLQGSPTLAQLFLRGQRLSRPFAGNGDKRDGAELGSGTFTARRHPTYFKIHGVDYGSVYHRNCEIGRRVHVKFDTDVEKDYFRRAADPGSNVVEFIDPPRDLAEPSYSMRVETGNAYLNMALPENVGVGDRLLLQVTVTDPTLLEPFVNLLSIEVRPHASRKPGHARRQPRGGAKAGFALPKVITVREGDTNWERYEFTSEVACHVISDPVTEDGVARLERVFYVNADNVALRTELKYAQQDPRLLEAKFKYATVLLGLALFNQATGSANGGPAHGGSNEGEEAVQEGVEALVRRLTSAVAPVLLPIIDNLSGLREEDFEMIGSGDDA